LYLNNGLVYLKLMGSIVIIILALTIIIKSLIIISVLIIINLYQVYLNNHLVIFMVY